MHDFTERWRLAARIESVRERWSLAQLSEVFLVCAEPGSHSFKWLDDSLHGSGAESHRPSVSLKICAARTPASIRRWNRCCRNQGRGFCEFRRPSIAQLPVSFGRVTATPSCWRQLSVDAQSRLVASSIDERRPCPALQSLRPDEVICRRQTKVHRSRRAGSVSLSAILT